MTPLGTDSNIARSDEASVASLAQSVSLIQRQCEEILNRLDAMREQLSQLAVRESELRVILERNTEYEGQLDRLDKVIGKKATPDWIVAAIAGASLQLEPFPYTVIDRVLPGYLYDALLRGLPPVELFPTKADGKQQLAVPFSLAPTYSQRVWTYLVDDVIPTLIAPSIIEKFRAPIDEWILAQLAGGGPPFRRAARERWPHHAAPSRLSHPAAPRPEVVVHHLHPVPRPSRRR